MADIRNTASILSYTYFSGGRERTGGPKSDSAVNSYIEPSIVLEKVCSVDGFPDATGADLNEIITLTYTVTNNSLTQVKYVTATVQDPILSNPSITIVPNSENGGSHVGDLITINIPDGLSPGESATYSIKIQVISPSASIALLQTNATATLSTEAGRINLAEDTCGLNYHHAELTLQKQNEPTGLVSAGQEITYTLVIGNTAETPGVVAIRDFIDPIPSFTTFLRIDNDGNGVFAYESSPNPMIYNQTAFTVEHNQTLTLTFTVVTVDQ